jgi:hypothetical protein
MLTAEGLLLKVLDFSREITEVISSLLQRKYIVCFARSVSV